MEATVQARAEHSTSQDGFTHPNIRHSFTRRNYNWIQQLFAKASIPQGVHQEHGHSSNQAPCHSLDIALQIINEAKFTLDLQSPAMSKNLFERMHIIREFYGGECANLNDLTTVIKNYMEPLRLFKILEPIEVHQIFYTLDKISPFFEDLITRLSEVIESCQGVPPIGKVFLKWLGIAQHRCPVSGTSQSQSANVLSSSEDVTEKFSPMVEAIIDYTAHLYEARECHEAICKHKPEFTDFLTRCNSTTFSKRLDLWHFLDCPRRRITRYPLLFGRLLNLIPDDDPERPAVHTVLRALSRIAKESDLRAGESRCLFNLRRIHLATSSEHRQLIFSQNTLLLFGKLRIGHLKVKAFLFPDVLLLTLPFENAQFRVYPTDKPNSTYSVNHRERRSRPSDRTTQLRPTASQAAVIYRQAVLKRFNPSSSEGSVSTSLSGFDGDRDAEVRSPCLTTFLPPELVPCESSALFDTCEGGLEWTTIPSYLERYRLYKSAILLKQFSLEDMPNETIKSTPLHALFGSDGSYHYLFRLARKHPAGYTHVHSPDKPSSPGPRTSSRRKVGRASSWFCRLQRHLSTTSAPRGLVPPDDGQTDTFVLHASNADEKFLWMSLLSPLVAEVIHKATD